MRTGHAEGYIFVPWVVRERWLLSRMGLPLGFYPEESVDARRILEAAGVNSSVRPVVVFTSGTVMLDPGFDRIATQLGFTPDPEPRRWDLAIIGSGPAGLAAAVYGASEGLATVVIDEGLPGGQAGTSSRIRNYLGFPTGVSGRDLLNRALEQAWFFGARIVMSKRATRITPAGAEYQIGLDGG